MSESFMEGAAGPVEGEVTLLRTDAGILALADLSSSVAITCSRCLAPARLPVEFTVEEEYYPSIDLDTGAPLPPREEDSPFLIDQHHILDLREAVRQQLVLAEPMQPLCREDCAGLCPACGADLNAGPCRCPEPSVDPRWSALNQLIEMSATSDGRGAGA